MEPEVELTRFLIADKNFNRKYQNNKMKHFIITLKIKCRKTVFYTLLTYKPKFTR